MIFWTIKHWLVTQPMGRIIAYMKWKIKNVWNHQPGFKLVVKKNARAPPWLCLHRWDRPTAIAAWHWRRPHSLVMTGAMGSLGLMVLLDVDHICIHTVWYIYIYICIYIYMYAYIYICDIHIYT
jgi:hypothetical protein